MRRRFKLLKPTFELKAGAILEEECDDGDQDFRLVNKEKALYDSIENNPSWYREIIINNPKWFEELLPFWVTNKQIVKIKKFLKI
jgi:hypothetical protein